MIRIALSAAYGDDAPSASRWQLADPALLTRPGLDAPVSRLTEGAIDVHIVTHEHAARRRRLCASRGGLSLRRRLAGALTGLVVLPLLTLALVQLREVLDLPSRILLYLIAVVVVALVGGLLPALAAVVAAALLLARYFIPPFNDPAVADPNNVVGLIGFLVVVW